MHNSVLCTVVFMKHVQSGSSCTIVSPFVHHLSFAEKKTKCDIFSAISVAVCRTRPTKIRISVSQLYPKLRNIHMKRYFRDTPGQLVQNVHRFAWCALGRLMLDSSALCTYSTEAKTMLKNTAWNQDGLLPNPTVNSLCTNNDVSVTKVQNMRCYASDTIVLLLA